jgi:aminopeptidase N
MLGDDNFKKALHAYMNNWNGKHPIPWDYFNSMSAATGRNLNWFFNNWFFTNNYIDLEIKFQSKINTVYTFAINNIGGFAIPFDMKVTFDDGTSETLHKTPEIWQLNEKQVIITLKTPKKIKEVSIDGGIFMDADERNNNWISK